MRIEYEYKLECLARELLSCPLFKRQSFLVNYEKRHGSTIADELKAEMIKQHKLKKAAA